MKTYRKYISTLIAFMLLAVTLAACNLPGGDGNTGGDGGDGGGDGNSGDAIFTQAALTLAAQLSLGQTETALAGGGGDPAPAASNTPSGPPTDTPIVPSKYPRGYQYTLFANGVGKHQYQLPHRAKYSLPDSRLSRCWADVSGCGL